MYFFTKKMSFVWYCNVMLILNINLQSMKKTSWTSVCTYKEISRSATFKNLNCYISILTLLLSVSFAYMYRVCNCFSRGFFWNWTVIQLTFINHLNCIACLIKPTLVPSYHFVHVIHRVTGFDNNIISTNTQRSWCLLCKCHFQWMILLSVTASCFLR